MRKISLWLLMGALTVCTARAQDAATQQQLDKLAGQIQDLTDAQVQQNKRLDALEKEIADLGEKINQPAANNSASVDDLKKLAEQVQEIDQKRQDDRDLILKQLEKLAKLNGTNGGHHTNYNPPPADTDNSSPTPTPPANVPSTGHPYTIAAGDTLAAIAKAYRAQGVKVTVKEIIAANPGLDANKLYVGKKIFIPDPSAK
jgi:LysM repeat protein